VITCGNLCDVYSLRDVDDVLCDVGEFLCDMDDVLCDVDDSCGKLKV